MSPRVAVAALAILSGALMLPAQQRIYWGDEVPAGWTGKWPAELQTVPERTAYTRTMSSLQLLEFITALKAKSESLHVVNMFTSPLRKVAPAMVLAEPARDVGAAGARVGQAGRVPVRQHPSARVGGRRGAADGRARPDGRHAKGPARQPDRHHRADLQRRRHRHVRHAGRIARQRDAAHPRHARERRRASTSIAMR